MVITDKKCSYVLRICADNKASDNVNFTSGDQGLIDRYIRMLKKKNMLTKMHTN